MTVSSTYDKQTYVANGVATSFAWSSDYDDTFGKLVVTQVDETESVIKTYVDGTDYFVQNKKVHFYEAPAAGTRIHLDRHTYRGQEVTFIEGEDFPAKDYETSLDRLFMIEQEQDKGLVDETAARIAADAVLQANIDTEEAARIAADTVLQNNIDAEETRAKAAEKIISDTLGTYGDIVTHNANEFVTVGSVGNGTITLKQGGVTKGTFTTNQSGDTTIDLNAGGGDGGVIYIHNILPTYLGTTDGEIDVSNYVDENENYFPIVTTAHDINIFAGRSGLTDCSYVKSVQKVSLRYDDNTYQKSNNVVYNVVLIPISDVESENSFSGFRGLCDGFSNLQTKTNLVTSVSSSSTDIEYPSAKCMYDIVGNIETLLQSI